MRNGRQVRAARAAPAGGSTLHRDTKEPAELEYALMQVKASRKAGRDPPPKFLKIIEAAEAAAKKSKEDAKAAAKEAKKAKEDAKAAAKVEEKGLNEYEKFVNRHLTFTRP